MLSPPWQLLVAAVALVVRLAFAPPPAPMAGKAAVDRGSCTFHGHKLFGRIQIVTAFPDLKVQIVDAFPDLRVQKVTSFPDKCGRWQVVDAFPDTKIQMVTAFPDLKIQIVDSFPGIP